MDPLTIILTPGLAGGLVIALIVLWRNRNFPSDAIPPARIQTEC